MLLKAMKKYAMQCRNEADAP